LIWLLLLLLLLPHFRLCRMLMRVAFNAQLCHLTTLHTSRSTLTKQPVVDLIEKFPSAGDALT
jgi:hypothetical protein